MKQEILRVSKGQHLDTPNGDTRNGDTRNGDTRNGDHLNVDTRNGDHLNVDTRNGDTLVQLPVANNNEMNSTGIGAGALLGEP